MKRLAALLLTLLLPAACVPVTQPPSPEFLAQCRASPDGSPPLADRGIGGTGAPLTREAERGIGGTGIAGVIQGFASVCVDGLEIAVDGRVPVQIDGQPASMASLRVGQFVTVAAGPPDDMPRAANIFARHEVVGPVEEVVTVHPALVVVAGQRVRVPPGATGDAIIQPGAWVAVSGLRGPDGDIIASRVDPAPSGRVLVHGPLIMDEGVAAIGSIPIRTARATGNLVDTFVVASGTYDDGILAADAVAPDVLLTNPPAYFGPETKRLVLQTTALYEAGAVKMTGGYKAASASGIASGVKPNTPAIVTLQARPDGSFSVIKMRAEPRFAPIPGPAAPATRPPRGAMASPPSGAGASTRVVTVTIDYQIPPVAGTAPVPGITGSEVVTLAARPDGSLTPVSATTGLKTASASSVSQPTGGGASAPATTGNGSNTGTVTITVPYGTATGAGSGAAGGSAAVTLAARPDGSYAVVNVTTQPAQASGPTGGGASAPSSTGASGDNSGQSGTRVHRVWPGPSSGLAEGRGGSNGWTPARPPHIAASVTTGPALVRPMILAAPSPLATGGIAGHTASLFHVHPGGWAGRGLAHSGQAAAPMMMRHSMGSRSFLFRFKMGR